MPAWSVTSVNVPVAVVVKEVPALAVGMSGNVQNIGCNIDIEPPITVIVAEGRHDA